MSRFRLRIPNGGVRGAAVETACQIELQAGPNEIVVSDTVRNLVAGSGICFRHTGTMTPVGALEALSLLVVERNLDLQIGAYAVKTSLLFLTSTLRNYG